MKSRSLQVAELKAANERLSAQLFKALADLAAANAEIRQLRRELGQGLGAQ